MSDLHTPPTDRSVKVAHLVFALLFLGLVGIWAMARADVLTTERLAVLAPAVLIAAGVIGLAASLASSGNRRRRHTRPQDGALATSDRADADSPTDSGETTWDAAETDDEPTREIR
jgi:hypothetical protein